MQMSSMKSFVILDEATDLAFTLDQVDFAIDGYLVKIRGNLDRKGASKGEGKGTTSQRQQ